MTSPRQPPPDHDGVPSIRFSGFVDAFLRSPVSGIAPWVVLSVCSGPGRFEEAVSAALGLSVLVLWIGRRRGVAVHLLEVFGVAFFAILAGVGLFASPSTVATMERWAGDIANVALASFAAVTLLIRRPFTLAYAKDVTPQDVWGTAGFLRVNYAITGVWAAAFFFSAVVGGYGDAVLRNPDEFWTGWILQLAATLFALAFTDFYPGYVEGRSMTQSGRPDSPPPSVARLFDWLPPFTLITGIVGLVTDSVSNALGYALIGLGVVSGAALRRWDRRNT